MRFSNEVLFLAMIAQPNKKYEGRFCFTVPLPGKRGGEKTRSHRTWWKRSRVKPSSARYTGLRGVTGSSQKKAPARNCRSVGPKAWCPNVGPFCLVLGRSGPEQQEFLFSPADRISNKNSCFLESVDRRQFLNKKQEVKQAAFTSTGLHGILQKFDLGAVQVFAVKNGFQGLTLVFQGALLFVNFCQFVLKMFTEFRQEGCGCFQLFKPGNDLLGEYLSNILIVVCVPVGPVWVSLVAFAGRLIAVTGQEAVFFSIKSESGLICHGVYLSCVRSKIRPKQDYKPVLFFLSRGKH